MLDLTVAMLSIRAWLSFFLTVWALVTPFQVAERPRIDAPLSGEVLRGVVQVTGNTDIKGFDSAEIQFRYQDDTTETWYLINQSRKPVENGALTSWDTTTIADGVYRLRVVVNLKDRRSAEVIVQDLQVRNYTPVENASIPQAQAATAAPTRPPLLATATMQPTPTGLPLNPAGVSNQDLYRGVWRGVGLTLAAFIILGLYRLLRSLGR